MMCPPKKQLALIEAALMGSVPEVVDLLDAGCPINGIDPRTADMTDDRPWSSETMGLEGQTALIAAAHRGHADVCRVLISRGADVHARGAFNAGEKTALHCAVQSSRLEIVDLLCQAGAEPHATEFFGSTALDFAVGGPRHPHSLDIVQRLLTYGADPNFSVGSGARSPLQQAALEGHEDMVATLLAAGASDLGLLDAQLCYTAGHGDIDRVVDLLDMGASINARQVIRRNQGRLSDRPSKNRAVTGCVTLHAKWPSPPNL